MTNPGLPPVLSHSHHDDAVDRAKALKDELDHLLEDVDAVLVEVAPAKPRVDA